LSADAFRGTLVARLPFRWHNRRAMNLWARRTTRRQSHAAAGCRVKRPAIAWPKHVSRAVGAPSTTGAPGLAAGGNVQYAAAAGAPPVTVTHSPNCRRAARRVGESKARVYTEAEEEDDHLEAGVYVAPCATMSCRSPKAARRTLGTFSCAAGRTTRTKRLCSNRVRGKPVHIRLIALTFAGGRGRATSRA
jgi:hypothetical protein